MVAMNVVINIQAYVVLVGMTVVIVEIFGLGRSYSQN